MPRRDHIIYTHPARANGFSYFYIGYRPGDSELFLRYKRIGDQNAHAEQMSVADMLKFLAEKNDHPNPEWPEEVVERAFMTLRAQVQRWQRGGGMAAC
jgi:hypothetical protein